MEDMHFIYRYSPKSLFARFMMIIIVPVLLFQFFTVYIFYQRHWSNVVSQTSQLISNNISVLIYLSKDQSKELICTIASKFNIKYTQSPKDLDQISNNITTRELNILYEVLSSRFKNVKVIENENEATIFIKENEQTFKFKISAKPLVNPTTYVFVLWLLFLNLAVIITSVFFAKNQIRSILELAKAADNFGKGIKNHFKPAGASEIRLAGFAFIKMRERIENQIKKHTKMLAMISHDLKTPLTRLKLQLELLPDEKHAHAMQDDINSMAQMIDSYLNFARGELTEELIEIDLSAFIRDYVILQRYPALKILLGKIENNTNAQIDIKNFTRVLDNIISNSSKYATKVQISVYKSENSINIDIEDNGQGVDDNEKELILKPFYRSDKSRHLDKEGNVGLGLAIAKEIIKEHGGYIKILDSKTFGGLMVKIILKSVANNYIP